VREDIGKRMLMKAFLTDKQYKIYEANKFSLDTEELSTRLKNQCFELERTMYEGVGQNLLEPFSGLWLINGLSCYHQNTAPNRHFTRQFDSIMNGTAQRELSSLTKQLFEVA
jgi:hypothetical protein